MSLLRLTICRLIAPWITSTRKVGFQTGWSHSRSFSATAPPPATAASATPSRVASTRWTVDIARAQLEAAAGSTDAIRTTMERAYLDHRARPIVSVIELLFKAIPRPVAADYDLMMYECASVAPTLFCPCPSQPMVDPTGRHIQKMWTQSRLRPFLSALS